MSNKLNKIVSSVDKKYFSIGFYKQASITNINNFVEYYNSLRGYNKILSIMIVLYMVRLLPKSLTTIKSANILKSANIFRELNKLCTTVILSTVILVLVDNHSTNISGIVTKIMSKINSKKIVSGCKYIVVSYVVATMCVFLYMILNKISNKTTGKNNRTNIIKICYESTMPSIFFLPKLFTKLCN